MAQRPFQTGAVVNLSDGESAKDVVAIRSSQEPIRYQISASMVLHPTQPLTHHVTT